MKYLESLVKTGLAAIASALLMPGGAAADPPLITPPGPTHIVVPVHDFSALWNTDAPVTHLFKADDLADLQAEMSARSASGQRLAAFESWVAGGTRRYAGLFRVEYGNRYLFTGLDAEEFEDQRVAQFGHGRRLIDVEVQMVGGERVYSGLWANVLVADAEIVLDGLEAGEFHDEWNDLKDEYRLVAFETWWEDDELQVYGVLRPGAEPAGTVLMFELPWVPFEVGFAIRDSNDLKLVDIDFASIPDEDDVFSGKWVPSATLYTPRSWLGVQYIESWLVPTNILFGAGYEFSAVHLLVMPLVDPTAGPMYMLDLEINTDLVTVKIGETPNQLKPLHDSGTPGPPKTWP